MMNPIKISSQHGSALLFAFVLLLALTFIAIAAVNTGVMGTKMATNIEEEINASQTATSMIDYILGDPDTHLPTTGSATVTVFDCADNACTTDPAVAYPAEVFATATNESLFLEIDYTNCGNPPRMGQGVSLAKFSSFSYRISADIDRVTTGRGKSSQRQGYMELGPKC